MSEWCASSGSQDDFAVFENFDQVQCNGCKRYFYLSIRSLQLPRHKVRIGPPPAMTVLDLIDALDAFPRGAAVATTAECGHVINDNPNVWLDDGVVYIGGD